MYNKRLCDLRHNQIDERLEEGKQQMEKLDRKISRLIAMSGMILVSIIGILLENLLG